MRTIETRAERRQMQRAKERHVKNIMSAGYTQFEDVTNHPQTQAAYAKHSGARPYRVLVNGLFVVQCFEPEPGWGAERMMIRWNDARPVHDWSLFQRIKNDIYGPDRIALEVYPSELKKVDVANMYWLWVLPAGFNCPIEVNP